MATLVLIPGLLCDRRLWSDQIAGLSTHTDISVADITQLATLTEMAASVLRAAPERFSLAGFSLGSQVALEIMQTARDRVERLALLSATHGGLLPPSMVAFREAVGVIERGDFQQYLDSFYPRYVAERRASDTMLRVIFMDMAHAVGPEAGLRQIHVLMSITEPFAKLSQIRCPTIVIGGREDRRTTPAAHEALAKEIPGAELIMIEDSGHFTTLEQPELVTQALRQWLAM
jgi:pimeloyl-ACP methyl ester carboxylesterase